MTREQMSIAEEVTKRDCEEIAEILEKADFSKCATPQMGRVYRHFNNFLTALVV